MTLRQLKWAAILVPPALVALLEFVRHNWFHEEPPSFWGNLAVAALLFLSIYLFAHLLFKYIDRLQRDIGQRNRELAALNSLALSVGRSLNLKEEIQVALEKTAELTQARGGTICLYQGGKLSPVHCWGVKEGEVSCCEAPSGADGEASLRAMSTGSAVLLSQNGQSRAFISLRGKEVQGVLCLYRSKPFDPQEADLFTTMGLLVGAAVENASLLARIEELAVIEERERIAREVHDGLAQVLGLLSLKAATIQGLLASRQYAVAEQELKDMERVAQEAYTDAREAILGLSSRIRLGGGFIADLTQYLQKFQRQSGIPTQLRLEGGGPFQLSPKAEVQIVRIIQEALTNVRKHARAQHAYVNLGCQDGVVNISVTDDGRGFDPAEVQPAQAGRSGYGLETMRERAESAGGSLQIEAQPGRGVRIEVTLPTETP